MKKLKMTTAYTIDQPRRWRPLTDFLIMASLAGGLVLGTDYMIKNKEEVEQYVSSKAGYVEKTAKEYLERLDGLFQDLSDILRDT